MSIAATVDNSDDSHLGLIVSLAPSDVAVTASVSSLFNMSDYALVVIPHFTHGRAGTTAANLSSVSGAGYGLRTRCLSVLQGGVLAVNVTSVNTSVRVPVPNLALALDQSTPLVLSTNTNDSPTNVIKRADTYRAAEVTKLWAYGKDWWEVKDAVQVSGCLWLSFPFPSACQFPLCLPLRAYVPKLLALLSAVAVLVVAAPSVVLVGFCRMWFRLL